MARAPNFTLYEKGILLDLVAKRKDILQNNRTDGVSVDEKNSAWTALAAEFNSNPKVHNRSVNNIRTGFENLKKNSKKNAANEKVRVHKTGGGDSPFHISTVDEKILALITPRMTPMVNQFDSDAKYNNDMESEGTIHADPGQPIHTEEELNTAQIVSGEKTAVVLFQSKPELFMPGTEQTILASGESPSGSAFQRHSKLWKRSWTSRRRPQNSKEPKKKNQQ